MTEQKPQRLQMSARFAVIVHRIMTKLFGVAGIDEQRAGLRRRFGEFKHRTPIILRGYLRERLATLADAERYYGGLLAGSLAAGLGYR